MKGWSKMRIWKLVITGGPCGGKTDGISAIEECLRSRGVHVIVVPETATELITSGIAIENVGLENFQSILFERSLNKEKTALDAARYMNKDTIILYDRGLLDTKAYMPEEIFNSIIEKYHITQMHILYRYDAVFHLVTSADGAEEFYTLKNNDARSETPEEARVLDRKTKEAWVEHPHLRIIDNSTDFEGKINRLLDEILSFIDN